MSIRNVQLTWFDYSFLVHISSLSNGLYKYYINIATEIVGQSCLENCIIFFNSQLTIIMCKIVVDYNNNSDQQFQYNYTDIDHLLFFITVANDKHCILVHGKHFGNSCVFVTRLVRFLKS